MMPAVPPNAQAVTASSASAPPARGQQRRYRPIWFIAETDNGPMMQGDLSEEDFKGIDQRGEKRQGVHDITSNKVYATYILLDVSQECSDPGDRTARATSYDAS